MPKHPDSKRTIASKQRAIELRIARKTKLDLVKKTK